MVNANLFSVVDVYLHWEIELVFLTSRQLQLDLGNLSWISLGTDMAVRAKCLCPSPRVTTVSWLIPHTMMEDAGGSLAPCGLGKKAAVNWKPSLLRLLWISWQRTSGVNEMESYSPMGGSSYTNCVSLCIIDDPPQCRNPLISALARVMNTLSPGAAVINPSVPIWWAGVLPSFENLILVLPWVLGFQRESGTWEQWGDSQGWAPPGHTAVRAGGSWDGKHSSGGEQQSQVLGHVWHNVPEEWGKEREVQQLPR